MLLVGTTTAMLMTLVAVLCVIVLGIIFYFLIRYNAKKFHDENDSLTDKTLTKADINKSISAYIKKVGKFGDFSLLYIDIDNFTSLNDVFGREQCDEFLVEIASRLQKRFPYRTLISKYNNDEFLVFIKENLTYEQVCKVADAILSDIKQKIYVSTNDSISISASIGICLYPSCGRSVDELIKNLELATYVSKREGGNKYTVFYRNMTKDESSNYQFFIEIKKAIANKEFCLYYQPIINLNTNNICAYEALMRWNHPEQGVLPPAKFMSIMEQSGDIKWVGKWGLEHIVSKYASVAKLVNGDFKMSLNLSTKQLTYETTADDLLLVARKGSVDPKNIILEIAGFTMFEKMENVKQNLLKLRDSGFTVAVDGFELDYSTIARIQKEPIDMIKLNRSFLAEIEGNPEDKGIKETFVKMLVESAEIAHRTVVCEGVETKEQEDYIKSQGINVGQGYYYSKPIPEDDIEDFIRYRKWEAHSDAGLTKDNDEKDNKPTIEELNKMAETSIEEPKVEAPAPKEEENKSEVEENVAPQVEEPQEAPAQGTSEEVSEEPQDEPQEEEKPVEDESKTSESSDDEDDEDDSDDEEKEDAAAAAKARLAERRKKILEAQSKNKDDDEE